MQGGRDRLGADAKTLIRILCHRSDSEAFQFLKKKIQGDEHLYYIYMTYLTAIFSHELHTLSSP